MIGAMDAGIRLSFKVQFFYINITTIIIQFCLNINLAST
jgi:hypothetical protein